MWLTCLLLSVGSLAVAVFFTILFNAFRGPKKRKISWFYDLFAGVFAAACLMFFPIHSAAADGSFLGIGRAVLLSLFNAMQVFAIGCEYGVVESGLVHCPQWLSSVYQIWMSALFAFAPMLTISAILSIFKNLSVRLKWMVAARKGAYLFSQLNERSLTLAKDLRDKHPRAAIVFAQTKEDDADLSEWLEELKQIRALCYPGKLTALNFAWNSRHCLYVFAMSDNETENINCALDLVGRYRSRENTWLYVFADGAESEVLLNGIDLGKIKLRRVNEAYHLIYRLLDDRGKDLFDSARVMPNGEKCISVVVVGMGSYGTEMVKAVSWFCQMNGYQLEINAFDKDPLAEEKFAALAPELMSPLYNGVEHPGEAQYRIKIHSNINADTATFAKAIAEIPNATFALVCLGKDQLNITTAVRLRMYFERQRIHPMIHAIVYNSQQKEALSSIRNFREQAYDIDFLGDIETIYTEGMIVDSGLEKAALRRHLKWGREEDFWKNEYNYRSSAAAALHQRARIYCGIPGADKNESDLTMAERDIIEALEHRRWNAYMRAEGYVYSGSQDKSSRNDLAKMHHDLVDYVLLSEAEKRKDSTIGTN